MKIKLDRIEKEATHTIGKLYVDGVFQCYTLEDTVREIKGIPVKEWKVYGETAIPAGTYRVIVTMSGRFKRMLPLLEGVEGFSGIRIHIGNYAADTEGCILVGTTRLPNMVGNSRVAFDILMPKIETALLAGENVTIEINN